MLWQAVCVGHETSKDVQEVISSHISVGVWWGKGGACLFVLLFVTSLFANKVMNNRLLFFFKIIFIFYMMF